MFINSSIFSSRKKITFPHSQAIAIHEHRYDQDLSYFSVYFNVGSVMESKKMKGICHLVEHLMFKSTKNRTAYEINRTLEQYGAEINAYTTFDSVCFHFSVLNEYFTKCLDVFADMLLHKQITEREFNTEKAVVIQELCQGKDSPLDNCIDEHYHHYYGFDPVIGYRQVLENITLSEVNDFIDTYMVPANMVISAVTNKSHWVMKHLIKKYFVKKSSRWTDLVNSAQATWTRALEYKHPVTNVNKISYVKDKTQQVQIAVSVPLPNISELDFGQVTYLCKLCTTGLSSIFYRELREKLGLAYGFHVETITFTNPEMKELFKPTINIYTSMEAGNIQRFITEFTHILTNVAAYITNSDIQRVNSFYKSQNVSLQQYASYNFRTRNIKHAPKFDIIAKKLSHMTKKRMIKFINSLFLNKEPQYLMTLFGKMSKKHLTKIKDVAIVNSVIKNK